MLSYHNNIEIKNTYIARMKLLIAQNALVKTEDWDGFQIEAIGNAFNKYSPLSFGEQLGLDNFFAPLLDFLYKSMSPEKSKIYPLLFLKSVPVGVDLKGIKNKFVINTLERTLKNFDNTKFKDATKAIKDIIKLLKDNCQDHEKLTAAAYTARVSMPSDVVTISFATEGAAWAVSNMEAGPGTSIRFVAFMAAASAGASVPKISEESTRTLEVDLQADYLIKILKEERMNKEY